MGGESRAVKTLEDKLARNSAQAAEFDGKHSTAMTKLVTVEDNVQSLFTRLGCNTAAVTEVLGSGGVTDTNVMQYLGKHGGAARRVASRVL